MKALNITAASCLVAIVLTLVGVNVYFMCKPLPEPPVSRSCLKSLA